MRVLQINATYGIGSTGRIVENIHLELKNNGHESFVFWAIKKSANSDANVWRIGSTIDHKVHAIARRFDNTQGFHSLYYTKKFCEEIEKIKPDLVHLHNLHSNYINIEYLINFLKNKRLPTLITLHDCWFFTGYCNYFQNYCCTQWQDNKCLQCLAVKNKYRKKTIHSLFNKKEELFSNFNELAINGVSEWTTASSKKSLLSNAKLITTIYNWVDTNVFKPIDNVVELKKKYNCLPDEKIVLGVSQGWSERKGLNDFYRLARELNGYAKIFLVGEHRGCRKCENLVFLGKKTALELVELYSLSNVFVNPSKMETFGLVTIEALACGTPVVAYNNTGSSEIVTDDCGKLVPDGNTEMLINSVKEILAMGKINFSRRCIEYVKDRFDKKNQVNKYIEFYAKIIKEYSKIDK